MAELVFAHWHSRIDTGIGWLRHISLFWVDFVAATYVTTESEKFIIICVGKGALL